MADPRFFQNSGPFTLAQLAKVAEAEIVGGDPQATFDDVQPLQTATSSHVSFLENKLYVDAFEVSKAGVCLVDAKYSDQAPAGMALLLTSEPYRAYARVAQAFYPKTCFTHAPTKPGVHAQATVHETAVLGDGCCIEAGAVIGEQVRMGTGCFVGANSTIDDGVELGDGCWIGANVTVQFAIVGHNCVFHPGVRIGQDGFGFAPGAQHIKVPQLGIVRIGDGVDIGANSCIDRGTGPDTIIGSGTKIDNLVQIGHNVEIGAGGLFPALTGISGSVKIGNYVMMGGGAAIAGHLTIGDGARIAARSGVMHDVPAGETYAGLPAIPAKAFWRQVAALKRLTKPKKGA